MSAKRPESADLMSPDENASLLEGTSFSGSEEFDSLLAAVARSPERLSAQVPGLQPGERLAHYEVRSLLGKGGMGLVYRAWDTRLQRSVALKLLSLRDTAWRSLLLNEARAGAAIRHPHIATIYSVEEAGGIDFLTMELVDGEPLAEVLRARRLPPAEALRLARQIAAGLGAMHAVGLVHRDLKPGNIVLQPDGQVKLLDFGLARFVPTPKLEPRSPPAGAAAPVEPHHAPEAVAGTRAYMAPEQEEGRPIGKAADVFSFGLVLYELLVGRLPTGWRRQRWTTHALTPRTREELRATGASLALIEVVIRCLWREPGARFQEAREVEAALAALTPTEAPRSSSLARLGPWLLAAAVGGVGVVGGWRWLRAPSHVAQGPPAAAASAPASDEPQLRSKRLTALEADQWIKDVGLQPGSSTFAYAERDGSVSLQRIGEDEPLVRLQPPGGRRAMNLVWQDSENLLVTLLDANHLHPSVWRLSGPPYRWEPLLSQGERAITSPSGQSIAYMLRGEVWLARRDGSGARRLAAPDAETQPVLPLRFSPDGSHLAFARLARSGDQHALAVVPVEGGQEQICLQDWRLEHPGHAASFVWLPGRILLSLTEDARYEAGSNVWELPVSNSGRPLGPPRQRTFWSDLWSSVVDGLPGDSQRPPRLVVSLSTMNYRTFVAPLEPGPALGPVQQLSKLQRSERLSGWTADDRSLWVTVSQRGGFALLAHSPSGGAPTKLSHPIEPMTHARATPEGGVLFWRLAFSPAHMSMDLRHQAAGREDSQVLLHLEVPPQLSQRAPLPMHAAVRCVPARSARTAPTPCVLAQTEAGQTSFFALDLARGKGRELFRLPEPVFPLVDHWDLSPDGLRIALIGRTAQKPLEVRRLDGQLLRSYSRAEGCEIPYSLAWDAQGRGLFLTHSCEGETRYVLSYLEEDGRYKQLLSSTHTYFRYVAASAEGGHLAWSALELDNDAWLVELDEL